MFRYIYIEDQFLFYAEALRAVVEALPHVEAVVLITNVGEYVFFATSRSTPTGDRRKGPVPI